jgi:WD40 repeat-containing protein SMU1
VGDKGFAQAAQFSPDGQWLATGSSEGFVEMWDFLTGRLRKDLVYQAEARHARCWRRAR